MTLRSKLVIALTLLSALAATSIGAATYQSMSVQLNGEINQSLRQAVSNASVVADALSMDLAFMYGPRPSLDVREQLRSDDDLRATLMEGASQIAVSTSREPMPLSDMDWELAASREPQRTWWRDTSVNGERFRIVTQPFENGFAVQVAVRIDDKERVLASIRNRTLASVSIVVVLAGLGGWLIARRATKRLLALTKTATEVASTGSVDVTPPIPGPDEVGQLGAAFGKMLIALQESRDAQTRLVQDAGHELRTPLTSLRTNIALLQRIENMDADTRREILADLEGEAAELSNLVNEIVELASDQHADEVFATFSLNEVVNPVIERSIRRSGRQINLQVEDEELLVGQRSAIARAVHNLIDNAIKFSPEDAPIDVYLSGNTIEVADRGVGIPAKDVGLVFHRFHRSSEARSYPGSGLGLAIVKEIAERHGGDATAARREGGGTCVTMTLGSSSTQDTPSNSQGIS